VDVCGSLSISTDDFDADGLLVTFRWLGFVIELALAREARPR
jgi:hypothetical protein